ncbi:MAG: type II toxin-antitoxin system VapC family toxin [Oceanicaulis sp.]
MLVDTQAAAWWAVDSPRLTKRAADAMGRADSLFLSITSVWETSIKLRKFGRAGSEPLGDWFDAVVDPAVSLSTTLLPIEPADCVMLLDLPAIHGDPFDRMIAAQAVRRGLPVVSADPVFEAYGCKRVW